MTKETTIKIVDEEITKILKEFDIRAITPPSKKVDAKIGKATVDLGKGAAEMIDSVSDVFSRLRWDILSGRPDRVVPKSQRAEYRGGGITMAAAFVDKYLNTVLKDSGEEAFKIASFGLLLARSDLIKTDSPERTLSPMERVQAEMALDHDKIEYSPEAKQKIRNFISEVTKFESELAGKRFHGLTGWGMKSAELGRALHDPGGGEVTRRNRFRRQLTNFILNDLRFGSSKQWQQWLRGLPESQFNTLFPSVGENKISLWKTTRREREPLTQELMEEIIIPRMLFYEDFKSPDLKSRIQRSPFLGSQSILPMNGDDEKWTDLNRQVQRQVSQFREKETEADIATNFVGALLHGLVFISGISAALRFAPKITGWFFAIDITMMVVTFLEKYDYEDLDELMDIILGSCEKLYSPTNGYVYEALRTILASSGAAPEEEIRDWSTEQLKKRLKEDPVALEEARNLIASSSQFKELEKNMEAFSHVLKKLSVKVFEKVSRLIDGMPGPVGQGAWGLDALGAQSTIVNIEKILNSIKEAQIGLSRRAEKPLNNALLDEVLNASYLKQKEYHVGPCQWIFGNLKKNIKILKKISSKYGEDISTTEWNRALGKRGSLMQENKKIIKIIDEEIKRLLIEDSQIPIQQAGRRYQQLGPIKKLPDGRNSMMALDLETGKEVQLIQDPDAPTPVMVLSGQDDAEDTGPVGTEEDAGAMIFDPVTVTSGGGFDDEAEWEDQPEAEAQAETEAPSRPEEPVEVPRVAPGHDRYGNPITPGTTDTAMATGSDTKRSPSFHELFLQQFGFYANTGGGAGGENVRPGGKFCYENPNSYFAGDKTTRVVPTSAGGRKFATSTLEKLDDFEADVDQLVDSATERAKNIFKNKMRKLRTNFAGTGDQLGAVDQYDAVFRVDRKLWTSLGVQRHEHLDGRVYGQLLLALSSEGEFTGAMFFYGTEGEIKRDLLTNDLKTKIDIGNAMISYFSHPANENQRKITQGTLTDFYKTVILGTLASWKTAGPDISSCIVNKKKLGKIRHPSVALRDALHRRGLAKVPSSEEEAATLIAQFFEVLDSLMRVWKYHDTSIISRGDPGEEMKPTGYTPGGKPTWW